MNHTITIPAEYVDDFRDAVVHEIADGTGAVETNRQGIRDAADQRRFDWQRIREEDWRGSVRLLAADGALLDQLERAAAGEEFTANGDIATLAHACAAMARRVVVPRVAGLLDYSPLDEKIAAAVTTELERLAWAVECSARLNATTEESPQAPRLAAASQ